MTPATDTAENVYGKRKTTKQRSRKGEERWKDKDEMSGCCVWLVVGMERLFTKMPQFEDSRVPLLHKRDASGLGEYDELDIR